MINGPFAFALAAGMVAAFNPCGFAMLPVYLANFMGSGYGTAGPTERTDLRRALAVGGVVSSGFVVVFAAAGFAFTSLSISIQSAAPWITLAIGILLIPVGIALMAGKQLKVSLPRMNAGTQGRGLGSMFLFGVSYGVVSLSCTLPVFLAAVSSTFTEESFVSGIGVFFAYGLGMTLVLMAITVALALARNGLVRWMKRFLPYVNRVSGALLVLAGAYVAYYGYWEIRLERGDVVAAGPVDFVSRLSARMNAWVSDVGALRLGVVLGAIAAVALVVGAVVSRLRTAD